MNRIRELAERVRRGEPIPAPVAALLSAATPVTRLGMWRRKRRPAVRVEAHVISFGNITVGGTGKTPAVIERAERELADGKRVAVLTRGYGARASAEPLVWSGGAISGARGETFPAEQAHALLGDEPALICRRLPNVVLIKGKDRVASARLAIERYGCDTLILDDGFQYVRLARDENIVVIDASNPFGNGRLLPRGILREPPEALARATHVILTHCDHCADLEALTACIEALCPGVPIRRTRHAPRSYWPLREGPGAGRTAEDLRGQEVHALCAIGKPEGFFATLEALEAHIVSRKALPDHAPIPLDAIPGNGIALMTEKDAVRIAPEQCPPNAYALQIELEDV